MQFDTAKNGLLVAGDDFSLKFWDLNAVDLVTPIDASEMLPVSFVWVVSFVDELYIAAFGNNIWPLSELHISFLFLRQVDWSASTRREHYWL